MANVLDIEGGQFEAFYGDNRLDVNRARRGDIDFPMTSIRGPVEALSGDAVTIDVSNEVPWSISHAVPDGDTWILYTLRAGEAGLEGQIQVFDVGEDRSSVRLGYSIRYHGVRDVPGAGDIDVALTFSNWDGGSGSPDDEDHQ